MNDVYIKPSAAIVIIVVFIATYFFWDFAIGEGKQYDRLKQAYCHEVNHD